MMNIKKRTGVFVAAFVVVLLSAAAAFAYWSTSGTGTGTAATGTSAPITVNQTTAVTAMGPGVAGQNLSGTFTNTTAGPVYVATVTASIDEVTPTTGNTCAATNYAIANPESTVGAEIPVGTGVGSWGTTDTPTIAFVNSPTVNQDGCQGATVTITYTIA